MSLSKVKSCQGVGDWNNEHGTFYKFEYTMEDGATLTASHKKQEGFAIGASVEYEIKGTNEHGSYGSVKKPDTGNYSGSGVSRVDSSSNRGYALSYAKDVLVASYMSQNKDILVLGTEQMFALADKMDKWLDNKEVPKAQPEKVQEVVQNSTIGNIPEDYNDVPV